MTHSIDPQRFADMAALSEDWDGYGAHPPTEAALAILGCFAVVPTTVGGLQFEWHAHGWDVEIEVDSDGQIEGVFVDKANR